MSSTKAESLTIRAISSYLEMLAPLAYQESYDNSGLLVGHPDDPVTGVLTTLDVTDAVLDEAKTKGCSLIVAHHPIIFKGLKKLNGDHYVERIVIRAIREGIAIYAIHTNLDNICAHGVNTKIAERLNLKDTESLAPKVVDYAADFTLPGNRRDEFSISLQSLSSSVHGDPRTYWLGTQKGRIFFARAQKDGVFKAIEAEGGRVLGWHDSLHPSDHVGSGMIGNLSRPMEEKAFLALLKEQMQTDCVRHTRLLGKPVQRVAVCGGSGGFLLPHARRQMADVFVTADYKYHEFFDADDQLIIADIGHFESEQFTRDLLYDLLSKKFPNFAVQISQVNTNPVRYYS